MEIMNNAKPRKETITVTITGTELKHTPGPWAYQGPYSEGGYLNSGYLIETGYDAHEPEPEVGMFSGREPLHGRCFGFSLEDARLIATAPEMLAACRAAIEAFGDEEDESAQGVLADIRDAITKATQPDREGE